MTDPENRYGFNTNTTDAIDKGTVCKARLVINQVANINLQEGRSVQYDYLKGNISTRQDPIVTIRIFIPVEGKTSLYNYGMQLSFYWTQTSDSVSIDNAEVMSVKMIFHTLLMFHTVNSAWANMHDTCEAMRWRIVFIEYTQDIFDNDLLALPAFNEHVRLCRPLYRSEPKAMVAVVAFTFLAASKRIKVDFYQDWMNKRLIAFCQNGGFSIDEHLPPLPARMTYRIYNRISGFVSSSFLLLRSVFLWSSNYL